MYHLHVLGTCPAELLNQLHYVRCQNPKTKTDKNNIEKDTEEDPINITNFAVAFQNTILKV